MDTCINVLENFGQNVLNYLLSISSDGDTILFAIDDDIYESQIFNGNKEDKVNFEKCLKVYVANKGLEFSGNDNIALALAAHQIKLAYDSKLLFEDNKGNGYKKTINQTLLDFYFSDRKNNEETIYQKYYDSINNPKKNLQDKLWERIRDILDKNNRKCIIPVGLKVGNREQKYMYAQLVVLRSLKAYFNKVFYFAGISKNVLYTRKEFEESIRVNLHINNSTLLKHILDEILERLKKYASEEERISFTYDENILIGQLWNFYNTWDGTIPDNAQNDDGYFVPNSFTIELFDEDEEDGTPAFFESDKLLNYELTKVNIARNIYFRLLAPHADEWTWKAETVNSDIPECSPFVILVEKEDIDRFSKKDCTIYAGSDENTRRYFAIKYSRKPDDFFAKLGDGVQKENQKISLIGGLRLTRNEYLDVGIDKALPQLSKNANSKQKEYDMKLFKRIEILNSVSDCIFCYKLIPHHDRAKPENCELCGLINAEGLKIPRKKVQPVKKKIHTEVPLYIFRAYIDSDMLNGHGISYDKLLVQTKFGFENISKVEGISDDDNKRLKKGIAFGCFNVKENPTLRDNKNAIRKIEFRVGIAKVKLTYFFEITEFEIIDVVKTTETQPNGNIITRNHDKLKGYTFKASDSNSNDNSTNYVAPDIPRKKIDYAVTKEIKNEESINTTKETDVSYYKEDLLCYQEALYLWLKHKGYASWAQIHNQCTNLVQTSGYYSEFGERPEYKIFMPLYKLGLIEIYRFEEEYIFCIAPNVPLFKAEPTARSGYSYRNHFLDETVETIPPAKFSRIALNFLKELPTVSKMINNNNYCFTADPVTINSNGIIKYSTEKFKREMRSTSQLQNHAPCVFKYTKGVYDPDYFCLNQNGECYRINRNIPDAQTVCKAFINATRCKVQRNISGKSNNSHLFTYYPNEKKLICHYLPDVPVWYARALILNNPEILKDDEIYLCYCTNHYEQVFTEVSEEFVQLLDEKYKD